MHICSLLLCIGILAILHLFTRSEPLLFEQSVISQGIFFFQYRNENSEKGKPFISRCWCCFFVLGLYNVFSDIYHFCTSRIKKKKRKEWHILQPITDILEILLHLVLVMLYLVLHCQCHCHYYYRLLSVKTCGQQGPFRIFICCPVNRLMRCYFVPCKVILN